MRKKYKGILIAALIALAAGSLILFSVKNQDLTSSDKAQTKTNEITDQKTENSETDENADSEENKNEKIDQDEDLNTDSNGGSESSVTGFEWMERLEQYKKYENGGGENSSKVELEEKNKVTFPYSIPGTDLIIKNIAGYSGVYLEDRSDSDIENVAAILVSNSGNKDIEYCNITLNGKSGDYTFTGSAIPAGSDVIIMAEDKKGYSGSDFDSIGGSVSDESSFGLAESEVKIVSTEEGKITLKNISNKDIPTVRVFYKFYLPEQDALVGGITYNSKVNNLKAGETVTLEPSHFAGDSSKIVMIRTYSDEN